MLAAAVVPYPPMLVPAIAAGSAIAAAPVLAACDAAVSALLAQMPQVIVCVGPGESTFRHPPGAWGTLAGFGVDVPAPGTRRTGRAHLPLSLTLGQWLLDRVGWQGPVIAQEVGPATDPAACMSLGARLDASVTSGVSDRACWLVLGDGSTRHGLRGLDPDAQGEFRRYDEAVAAAFGAGDVATIAAMDAGTAEQAGAAGRPAWQVLAGAVAARAHNGTASPASTARQSAVASASLTYRDAPFGVGYVVANWWLST